DGTGDVDEAAIGGRDVDLRHQRLGQRREADGERRIRERAEDTAVTVDAQGDRLLETALFLGAGGTEFDGDIGEPPEGRVRNRDDTVDDAARVGRPRIEHDVA